MSVGGGGDIEGPKGNTYTLETRRVCLPALCSGLVAACFLLRSSCCDVPPETRSPAQVLTAFPTRLHFVGLPEHAFGALTASCITGLLHLF